MILLFIMRPSKLLFLLYIFGTWRLFVILFIYFISVVSHMDSFIELSNNSYWSTTSCEIYKAFQFRERMFCHFLFYYLSNQSYSQLNFIPIVITTYGYDVYQNVAFQIYSNCCKTGNVNK